MGVLFVFFVFFLFVFLSVEISMGVLFSSVLFSSFFLLLGTGVFGDYWYIRHRETQTHNN